VIAFALIAASLTGGGCKVVVANNAVAYAAPAAVYHTPYYTASALAYKVEDPERSALVRQNERLTEALVDELKLQRDRADRLESAIATSEGSVEGPQRLPPLTASQIVRTNCAACHVGDKAKGGFTLSDKPNHAERLLINNVVQAGEMPPRDKRPLGAAEKKLIDDWAVVNRAELKAAAKIKP